MPGTSWHTCGADMRRHDRGLLLYPLVVLALILTVLGLKLYDLHQAEANLEAEVQEMQDRQFAVNMQSLYGVLFSDEEPDAELLSQLAERSASLLADTRFSQSSAICALTDRLCRLADAPEQARQLEQAQIDALGQLLDSLPEASPDELEQRCAALLEQLEP